MKIRLQLILSIMRTEEVQGTAEHVQYQLQIVDDKVQIVLATTAPGWRPNCAALLLLLPFPAVSLGFTILGEIFVYVTVF